MNDQASQPHRRRKQIEADLILLAVAIIWGSGFVAQRAGNEQIGPFTFNALRFTVGSLVLLPLIGWRRLQRSKQTAINHPQPNTPSAKIGIGKSGALLGLLLFSGATFQQIGLIYTTAGEAGFITGLYVVIIPLLLAAVWRERIRWSNWTGAALAVVGLFLLNEQAGFKLGIGDVWILGGAFVWALHVIAVGRLIAGRSSLQLALMQYVVCAALSLIVAAATERSTWTNVPLAAPAILYAGGVSIGLAYTAQIVAQRHAPPTHAAIIMSLEAVFAVLFGGLLLGETLSGWQLVGCGLMLVAMVLAQVETFAATAKQSAPHPKTPVHPSRER